MKKDTELYESLFSENRDAVIFFKGTTIVDANKAALNLFEITNKKEFIGKQIYEYTRDEEEAQKRAEQRRKGISEFYTRKIYTQKGVKEIEVSSTPITSPEITSYSIIRDVTEKNELQRRLHSIFNNLNDLVVVTNENGVAFINPKGAEYLGYTNPDEIIGDPTINHVHPDYRELATTYAEMRRKGENPPNKYRLKLVHRDGHTLDVEINASLITWDNKSSSLVIARDINDQIKLEEELSQRNTLFNNFIESATEGFTILDQNLNLIEINKTVLNRFELSKLEIVGKNITELRPDAKESGLVDKYKKVLETGETYVDDFTINTKNGLRHLTVKAFKAGNQLGVITSDITEQKQNEIETQRSREQLLAFMESATDGLALFDKNMYLVAANNVWLNNADLTQEQALGKYCEDIFPTLAETGRLDAYFKVLETGEPVEFSQVTAPRGGIRFLNIKAFKAGEGLGLISSDITEHAEYNNKLEQLHKLSDDLSRTENIAEIAEIAVETARNTLNCKRVSFQIKQNNNLVILAAKPDIAVKEIPIEKPSIVSRVIKTGRPQHVPDTTIDPDYYEAININEPPSLSEYAHPIKLKGDTVAVLNLEEPEKNAFTEQTIRLVSILADHVSAALHTQSYRDKLEKKLRGATYLASSETLEEVYEITLGILKETIEFSWAGVAAVGENQLKYTGFSGLEPEGEPVIPLSSKSITTRTVKTGKTQLISDTRLDPDYITLEGITEPNLSELSVPVFVDGSVKLVLNLENKKVNAFDKSDVRLVEILANHLSTTIRSILALNERQKYEEQLEALNKFGAEVAALNSIEEIAVYTMDSVLNILKHSTGSFGVVKNGSIRFLELLGATTTTLISLNQKGITTRAVNTRTIQLVPDIRLDSDYLNGRVEGEETLSELDVPVIVDDVCVAIINLESNQLDNFSKSDVTLVKMMADHISSSINRINQQNKILETERKVIREQERAEQAIELEEMKTNFIRTATHEIRTPLASIQGYTELAQKKIQEQNSPDLNRYFDAILRNTKRLESLTADLLDVQRLESGGLMINKAPYKLQTLLKDLRLEMKPILDSKNQKIILPSEDMLVNVDRIRMIQVLVNLVMNASKFSPEGSEIKIKVTRLDDMVSISVTDEGVGIKAEDMSKLFKPFPGIKVKGVKDSTGLGLSICKGLVELHGGEIWAESEGLGKGSTFTLTCPCASGEDDE